MVANGGVKFEGKRREAVDNQRKFTNKIIQRIYPGHISTYVRITFRFTRVSKIKWTV